MSSHSRKYSSASNPEVFLFITWETGYKHMRVYHNGKELFHVESAKEIVQGVQHPHPEGGLIEIKFTKERPLQLVVKVDKERYYASQKMQQKDENEALNSVSYAFWTLFGLSVVGTTFLIYQYRSLLFINEVKVTLIIDGLITLSYGATAFLIARRVKWIYFVGTGIFALTTLSVIGTMVTTGNVGVILNIIIRIGILVYILRFAMRIIRMTGSEDKTNPELLDSDKKSTLDF